ncbi:MAG: proline dehydrogenase [Aliifodinibius sp.]|nr:proline dehydrogenase [Fodinibius sp.]
MLRSLLIYLSQADWLRRLVMGWKIARKVALRFVAGETLESAIKVVRELNSASMTATLDQLGEHTETEEQASRALDDLIRILEEIDRSGIQSGLSVKLSQIGLLVDEKLCQNHLVQILNIAKEKNLFVRIDMEDSACIEATFRIYWNMRHKFHFDNVGMVIQSYLYRSDQDTADLLAQDTRIRMVKGAYDEPAEIAYPKKADVDKAFDRLVRMMLDHAKQDTSPAVSEDGRWPPVTALGTHDKDRIDAAIAYAQEIGVPKEKLEIQMLHGIRRDLQRELAILGYPVRIYVPFGTEWYPYFMRRLAERPANLWFFISSYFKK